MSFDPANNMLTRGEWVGPVFLVRYPAPVLDLRPQRIRWFTVTPEQAERMRTDAMSLYMTEHADEAAARAFAEAYAPATQEQTA